MAKSEQTRILTNNNKTNLCVCKYVLTHFVTVWFFISFGVFSSCFHFILSEVPVCPCLFQFYCLCPGQDSDIQVVPLASISLCGKLQCKKVLRRWIDRFSFFTLTFCLTTSAHTVKLKAEEGENHKWHQTRKQRQ